jgi:divalent metal cation (Fe/Co/Zn/Cd) transporter
MDTSPNRELLKRITALAAETPEVQKVEKCLVRKMGYTYFVDMHIEVAPEMTVLKAHGIAHQVKDNIRRALPQISDVLVHIEPGGRGRER